MKNKRHTQAFSLLELLATLAIMSILSYWTWTASNKLIRSSATTVAGNAINDALVFARQEAIARHAITAAVVDWNEKRCAVFEFLRDENTGEPLNEWRELTSHWRKLPKSIVFDQSSPSARQGFTAMLPTEVSDFVMFDSDGTIYGANRQKAISVFDPMNESNYYKSVVIAATGIVKVERPANP